MSGTPPFAPRMLSLRQASRATVPKPPASLSDRDAESCIESCNTLMDNSAFGEARTLLLNLIEQRPDLPMAYNNLGWIYELTQQFDNALDAYNMALQLNSQFELARRNLGTLLYELGRYEQAYIEWQKLLELHPDNEQILTKAIEASLRAFRLEDAAEHAQRYAAIQRGTPWSISQSVRHCEPRAVLPPPHLSAGCLRHDIEQLAYLRQKAVLPAEFDGVIDKYQQLLDDSIVARPEQRVALSPALDALVGSTYGRIVNLRRTPALAAGALSADWSRDHAQAQYFTHSSGLVVIDNFLTEAALAEVRAFCLESTVWFANRYAHGRLGAFFRLGFNCPLLIQIATELRTALPAILESHPLLQLWGFKYGRTQPETSPHADFAAVNVNFWITPDIANLCNTGGGLHVYDVQAPANWNFDRYNKDGPSIRDYIIQVGGSAINIPYRANRAVIFNSNLFHSTAAFTFAEGYANRRINVTMLYGNRRETCCRTP